MISKDSSPYIKNYLNLLKPFRALIPQGGNKKTPKMIRQVIFLCIVASACCQYPRQRAPPQYQGPPVEEFVEEYDTPPRQAPPPQALRSNSRQSDVYRPASVHYVNIGHELAGDYKFGYDTGKGNDGQSFREETRLPDGSVQGAYGYVDETGKQRIVKYTAGLEGFKVVGDEAAGGAPRSAPARQSAPAQAAPAPQQSYRPPPQQAYAPQPQPAPRPQPQPAYRPAPQPQPAYRPAPQPAYRPPPQQAYAPQPQPAPRPQPQPAPRHQPQPRPRYQAPRPQPEESYDDYDYPNNDISERRLVPVDTSLFNYNIGTSGNRR